MQPTIIVFDLNGVVLHLSPLRVTSLVWQSPYKWRMFALAFNPWFVGRILRGLWRKQVLEQLINELAQRHTLFTPMRSTALEIVNAQYARPALFALLQELKEKNYRLAILTNIGQESIEILTKANPELFKLFDYITHSSAHDGYCAKPNPKAFEKLLSQIRQNIPAPRQPIFVDDHTPNITQAEHMGMTGIRYRGTTNLRKQLQKIGVNLAA